MTELARKLHHASVQDRKAIVRDIIDKVPLFHQVTEMSREAGRPLMRQEIVRALSATVGTHRAGDVFDMLVYWGRYARLVYYDSQSESFSLGA